MTDPPRVVVMGVSGSGKSSVGAALAAALVVPFADGDGLHPAANVVKMSSGVPLSDADRAPWLDLVGEWLVRQSGGGVIACSALRAAYRRVIAGHCPGACFVHLDGPTGLVRSRLAGRTGHFMPAGLLASQYDALEPLGPEERGMTISVDRPVERIVADALEALRSG